MSETQVTKCILFRIMSPFKFVVHVLRILHTFEKLYFTSPHHQIPCLNDLPGEKVIVAIN